MKPLLLAIALLLAPVATPVSAVAQTVERRVEAAKAAGSIPAPDTISGLATWYSWHPAEAAAGPALRSWLGSSWRGTVVWVTSGNRSVSVRLTDFMVSGRSLVDLDSRSFAKLAPLSTGVLHVTITRAGTSTPVPLPTGPPTDAIEGSTP